MTQLETAPAKLGRKRDTTRDPEILDATIDVLAESGYDGMTIDMVAARAKAGKATVYRRWASKSDLVIDAIGCMKNSDIDFDNLPDTGTLRGDLVAMIKPHSVQDATKKIQVMAGIVSMMSTHPELADAIQAVMVEPRRQVNRIFLKRAIDRGEIRPDIDIDMIALVSAAMVIYRTIMLRKPVDRAFLLSVIDDVLWPAVAPRTVTQTS